MEPIAIIMKRLEWFRHVKSKHETEKHKSSNRGRPRFRWPLNTVRRDMKVWKIGVECATDRESWKNLCKTSCLHRETTAKCENARLSRDTYTVENVFFAYDTNTAFPSTSNGVSLLITSRRFVLSWIEFISMNPNPRLVLVTSSRMT